MAVGHEPIWSERANHKTTKGPIKVNPLCISFYAHSIIYKGCVFFFNYFFLFCFKLKPAILSLLLNRRELIYSRTQISSIVLYSQILKIHGFKDNSLKLRLFALHLLSHYTESINSVLWLQLPSHVGILSVCLEHWGYGAIERNNSNHFPRYRPVDLNKVFKRIISLCHYDVHRCLISNMFEKIIISNIRSKLMDIW